MLLLSLSTFRQFLHNDSGQDLIEYALVACLIALGAVAAMKNMANAVKSVFSSLTTVFQGAI